MPHAIQYKLTSVADYLEQEQLGDTRHEYIDGDVYAMSGASELHNAVTAELFASIYAQIPDECRAFIADMKVKVEINDKIFFYYPDIVVACGPNDGNQYFRTNPQLLVEVLSPSTRRTDLGEKLLNYSQIPSLMEYVIVHQDNPHVQVYRRRNGWQAEHFFSGDTFKLESVALEMTVDKIYRKVRREVGLDIL